MLGRLGHISFVKSLNRPQYDVILVSPHNYFLYTPLSRRRRRRRRSAPSSSPCTSSEKSWYSGLCRGVTLRRRRSPAAPPTLFEAADADCCPWHTFDVEYDYLVTAVGAVPNTFGVPVSRRSMFFKEIVTPTSFDAR